MPEARFARERRHYPRISVSGRVEVALLGRGFHLSGVVRDISVGGARVHVARCLRRGTSLTAVVSSADRSVVIAAVVAAATTVIDWEVIELRLQFVNLSPTRREYLTRMLDDLS